MWRVGSCEMPAYANGSSYPFSLNLVSLQYNSLIKTVRGT